MGITEGQLKKRGKTWHWRYRLDGVLKSRSLKTDNYQEARRIRQALISDYREHPERLSRGKANPTVDDFEVLYFEWAATNRHRAATVDMKRLHWANLDYLHEGAPPRRHHTGPPGSVQEPSH